MDTVFKDFNHFKNGLDIVYYFHDMCFHTIVDGLLETGDIELDEDEQDEFRFDYLELEGTFTTLAIRLTNDKKSFYLESVDEDNQKRDIYWEDINHDLIIEEMIVTKVFNTINAKKQ